MQTALTYDLKSGQPLDLHGEFRLETPAGTLRPEVLPMLFRHAKPLGERDEDVRVCYDDDTDANGDPAYRVELALTAGGLKVMTDFADHASAGCESRGRRPYAELRALRRQGSHYHFGTRR